MPLTPTADLLAAAVRDGRGVGAFNVVQLEHAHALAAAAEHAGRAVVLQISENCVRYHGSLAPLLAATLAVAAGSSAPVAVHLDHVVSPGLVDEALGSGIGSVMFDASALPYAENVARTREVAARCRAAGVAVEAELGEVGGKDGVHAPGARTDPAEAAAFAAATGVDALAVAVGSSHAMRTRDAALDFELVAALRAAVPVPLVLHGASGIADADLTRAVRAGLVKVNISTHLNAAFTAAARAALAADPELVDPRRYLGPARDAVAEEAARLLDLLDAVPAAALPATGPPGAPGRATPGA
ncbi:class II fructose-bisphosphate aldolase [Actinokineospora bangkokensis]|uniref:Fructose-bisphosphate aldolase n=1 Tax=Actinokineospora bangkokensis TaxID=1193682 RepID=A0A1Q9LBL9_9PSEU|nr:class II fructose-bisphosphate aldolase [Actinokineospora bangkokensis]OLR89431.1 fructose-bisphosphate aldolase [Actinokineospora bangkokensis]